MLTEDVQVAREAVLPMLSLYGSLPFYAGMLKAAGIDPERSDWTGEELDRIVIWGGPERIAERTRSALNQGIDEVTLKVFAADDPAQAVGQLAPLLR